MVRSTVLLRREGAPVLSLSLIINTYNRRHLLLPLLGAIQRQTLEAFEVVIADDGSSDGTPQSARQLAPSLRYPLKVVTQEDRGFRAAASRNNGARAAAGSQLVFMDDDCLPSDQYLQLYRAARAPETLLRGDIIFVPSFDHLDQALEVKRAADDLWGANFSVPADLFWKIGGFDEDFIDEAGEDTDLHLRLLRAGAADRRVEGAEVWHLGHHHAGGLSRNLFWDQKVHDQSIRRNLRGDERR